MSKKLLFFGHVIIAWWIILKPLLLCIWSFFQKASYWKRKLGKGFQCGGTGCMLSNEICSIFFAVNTFSHRAEFLWPPGCNHLMLPSWQIETCPLDHPEECRRDSLREQRNGGTYLYMYTIQRCRSHLKNWGLWNWMPSAQYPTAPLCSLSLIFSRIDSIYLAGVSFVILFLTNFFFN